MHCRRRRPSQQKRRSLAGSARLPGAPWHAKVAAVSDSEQIRPDVPPKRKHPTTAGAVGCRMLSLFKLSCRVYGFYARPNRARCKRSYIWFRPLYVTRVTKWCDEGHKRPSSSLSFARSLRRHHKDFLPFDVSISVLDGRLIRRQAKHARRKCEPCLVRVSRRRVFPN